MGALTLDGLPDEALLLIDTPPIIYMFEGHAKLAPRFQPLFEANAAGRVRLAVSTTTISEVLTGPFKAGDEVLARRYRAVLESWHVVSLDTGIAESAARLRASLGLKFADAVQAASALAINASALVTHDRDFGRLRSLRIIS